VKDRECDNAKASHPTEVMQNFPDRVAFGGQGSQFASKTGEQQEAETEQQPQGTPQDLVSTNQSDAKWAHGFSCGNPQDYITEVSCRVPAAK